ncbi:cupin domain-containing protein [Lactococcus lactis]|uniref:cupin domain-containing protein n=1 Tax=Lactococcus lactis TaxID=1358 RepID=UPI001913C365|nr:cupin domain-containing protein [Lactococcus lactis]
MMIEQPFALGQLSKDNPNFNGAVYLEELTHEPIRVTNVTFDTAVRNHWHIHHKGGQILLVTAGSGWYQAWGEPAQFLKTGDVVNIPAEQKHWHGAAKDSQFVHVAISVPAVGASTEWLEAVTDEDFSKLERESCG